MRAELEPMVMNNIGENPKKKSGVKKVVLIIFVVLIGLAVLYLIVSSGIKSCNRSRYKDEFYLQQEVQKYLEERYNEEFMVMLNRGMSGAYNYVQLYAYPITYQDEMHKIEIQGYYNDWGKMDFYDDYVMIKLTEEYEAYIDPIIDEYFDEYKFYLDFNAEWMTNNLPADTKLEDLWELKANEDYPLPRVFLYLNSNEEENYNNTIIDKIAELLQEHNFRGLVSMRLYHNDEIYEKRNRENIYEAIENSTYDVTGENVFIYDDKIDY